ncbi:MAG: porphobilinogen synthase [Deltaproteobacteria bacterium]|nr:porphobilinogen synthase [Deltaproteobacteria bacterium]
MSFPRDRLRRLRGTETVRRLVRETRLSLDDLILPLFVVEGHGLKEPVTSMPGVQRFSVDQVVDEAKRIVDLGLPGVILFGIPDEKDARGSGADAANGIVQKAVEAIKSQVSELCVITDVCLCEYTDHGHCGLVDGEEVANDSTLERLTLTAISHASAGADMLAPSDMMDGRVAAIRRGLDDHGFESLPIMSYAAKQVSAFYGPFRDAAESAPQFGDRRSYQMDPANRREALREMRADLEEGADILMVKPALSCLDIIADARDQFEVPIAAYQVSGEYSMIHAAAQNGWLDGERAMYESILAIKRAGADMVLTYAAAELAIALKG